MCSKSTAVRLGGSTRRRTQDGFHRDRSQGRGDSRLPEQAHPGSHGDARRRHRCPGGCAIGGVDRLSGGGRVTGRRPQAVRRQRRTRGCRNVNGEIAEALRGRTFTDLAELDHTLIDLDGTDNKSRLGANAVVGVSMAAARGLAIATGLPLWQTLNPTDVTPRLPVPHFNVVNGGVHAPNDLDFQEFMVAPLGAPTMAEAVRAGPP